MSRSPFRAAGPGTTISRDIDVPKSMSPSDMSWNEHSFLDVAVKIRLVF
jgi:hypothetical protein